MKAITLLSIIFFLSFGLIKAQNNETGAWYMYFGDTKFKDSQFGIQADIQYRNWNLIGDLEQLLLRGALNYELKDKSAQFAIGYAHITSGIYGDSDETSAESRIFQEMVLPHKMAQIISLKHRFRYEQRFVDNQDFRTRFRYALFLNIPLNSKTIETKSLYMALYNELFINGEKNIGENRTVQFFDRNRAYAGLGYQINKHIKVQIGYMNQQLNATSKNQLQVSLHHQF